MLHLYSNIIIIILYTIYGIFKGKIITAIG